MAAANILVSPREADQIANVKIEEGRDLLALLPRVGFVRRHRIQLHGEIHGRFARHDLSRVGHQDQLRRAYFGAMQSWVYLPKASPSSVIRAEQFRTGGLTSRPDIIRAVVGAMLKRLQSDRIDLLHQHRVDCSPCHRRRRRAGLRADCVCQHRVSRNGRSQRPRRLSEVRIAIRQPVEHGVRRAAWHRHPETGRLH
jgi:hypothetical protein